MLRDFFYRLPLSVARCFLGVNFLWHLFAIGLTYVLVVSGFDWRYFESTRGSLFLNLGFPAALLGFLVPIILPVSLYVFGNARKSAELTHAAAALGQSAIVGWLISSFYKAFTGRIQPELFTHLSSIDASKEFYFGFLRHGIFWGWPSSHATVAFAMAALLLARYPHRKEIVIPAVTYALYIGLGVSVTIHWFSDVAAAAIMGTLVGVMVARNFRLRGTDDTHTDPKSYAGTVVH
jgi:membrane-associated phospholipid phosphatase